MIKCRENSWRANLRQIKAQKRRNTLRISSFCNTDMANDLPPDTEAVLISVYLEDEVGISPLAAKIIQEAALTPHPSRPRVGSAVPPSPQGEGFSHDWRLTTAACGRIRLNTKDLKTK